MKSREEALARFENWYASLKRYKGFPAKGTLSGALVVRERLKTGLDLRIEFHNARGGTQIKGVSGEAIKRILNSFGETRPLASEGGRTNRGLHGEIESMLVALKELGLRQASTSDRGEILSGLQHFLVEQIREFHGQQRLRLQKAARNV